jgi:hypothetical protein
MLGTLYPEEQLLAYVGKNALLKLSELKTKILVACFIAISGINLKYDVTGHYLGSRIDTTTKHFLCVETKLVGLRLLSVQVFATGFR